MTAVDLPVITAAAARASGPRVTAHAMSDLTAIKLAIRNELHADGCTQVDLARYLGVSPVSVSRILTGRRHGSHALLEAMAHAVGLTLAAKDTP